MRRHVSSAEAAGAALRTLSGDPLERLAQVVSEEDVVAPVLGARRALGGPRPAGHVALTLAGRTDKPVVVVPPDAQPPEQLHRVLVAMEGGPGKSRALQRTIELSTDAGFEIVVVHVDEEIPSFTDQVQHETEAYTREFFARHIHGAPRGPVGAAYRRSGHGGARSRRCVAPRARRGRMAPLGRS